MIVVHFSSFHLNILIRVNLRNLRNSRITPTKSECEQDLQLKHNRISKKGSCREKMPSNLLKRAYMNQ
jgi:hypothetical protein